MDKFSWIALRAADGVGPVLFRRLLERFETPANVLAASPQELQSIKGMSPATCAAILGSSCQNFAEQECRKLEQSNIRLLTFLDANYPRRLLETGDAPPLLYLRGVIPSWDPAVAVVGSRQASRTGLKAAEQLSAELAETGVMIVSGLARGIDTAAHRGALRGNGSTVAVLGCGIDVQYPPENRDLADQIAETGAIISEFPLGTQPLAEHFPRRNRIISGLCRGILVVEAAEKSGSLITARYALDQGREVMAVPGPINLRSCRGSNRLIKQGAQLVDCLQDILDALAMDLTAKNQSTPLFDQPAPVIGHNFTPREAALYELVAQQPRHIDELTALLELTAGEVSAMVLGLELKGLLQQLPGSYYSLP